MKRRLTTLIGASSLVGACWALQVTPTYQIFTVDPGKKVSGKATVTNDAKEKINVDLLSKDWFVLPENTNFKAHDWLTFPDSKFSLDPGESKVVTFNVEAPKKAQGELVAMMSYSFNGEIPSNVQRILSLAVYCAVAKTEKLSGNLKQMMVTVSSDVLNVSLLVQNTGNVHIRPTGRCEIQDSKGDTHAIVLLDQSAPIYPGKEVVCTGKVKDLRLSPGDYKALIHITDVDRERDVIKMTKKFELLENNQVEIK